MARSTPSPSRGTNAIHGDLFYYLRYPALNALDPYSKYQGLHNGGNPFLLTQPIHQQQQFGGSIGGPIIKDRLFYFFTYDGFRRVGRVLYSNTNTISLTPSGPTTSTTTITPTQCPATIIRDAVQQRHRLPAQPHPVPPLRRPRATATRTSSSRAWITTSTARTTRS